MKEKLIICYRLILIVGRIVFYRTNMSKVALSCLFDTAVELEETVKKKEQIKAITLERTHEFLKNEERRIAFQIGIENSA